MIKCKKIATLIAVTMLLTSGRYAYAAESNVSQEQSNKEVTTSENVSKDSNDTEELSIVECTGEANPEESGNNTDNTNVSDADKTLIITSADGVVTITGTIGADETSYIPNGFFRVEPGQMIHASLTVPNDEKLNYDLYLYDLGTNSIVDTCAYPTYSNTGKYLDETVGYVNTTSAAVSTTSAAVSTTSDAVSTTSDAANYYCLLINAPKGGNADEPFTLKVVISDKPDSHENDDNAFTAIKINNSTTINRTIDSPLDTDWYAMPLSSSYSQKAIDLVASDSVNLDAYVHLGNGCFYKLAPISKGSFTAFPGYTYYIKISDKENGSETYPKDYTLQTIPFVYASNVTISGYEGVNYNSILQMNVCHENGNLTVKGTVTSADGEKLANKPVHIKFYDRAWAEHTKQESWATSEKTGYTDSDGNYAITLKLPDQGLGECIIYTGIYYPHCGDVCTVQADVLDGSGAGVIDLILMQTD